VKGQLADLVDGLPVWRPNSAAEFGAKGGGRVLPRSKPLPGTAGNPAVGARVIDRLLHMKAQTARTRSAVDSMRQ